MGSDCISSWSLLIFLLWIDCLFEIRKIAACFLWLSLPAYYRVTDEAYLAETVVWPIFFLMNVFIALKGTHFLYLFRCVGTRRRGVMSRDVCNYSNQQIISYVVNMKQNWPVLAAFSVFYVEKCTCVLFFLTVIILLMNWEKLETSVFSPLKGT